MSKKNNYFKDPKSLLWVIPIVLGSLLLLYFKYETTDTILIAENKITIEGTYGETIGFDEIKVITLSDSLPAIGGKSLAYAKGEVRKGYFKTSHRKRVKLILNTNEKPYIYIKTIKNNQIYFSETGEKNKKLLDSIKKLIRIYNPNYHYFN